MANQETLFLAKRAEALAIVHLTRRDDLTIIEQERDYIFDLLVEIESNSAKTGRFLGVEVKYIKTEKQAYKIKNKSDEYEINIQKILSPKDVPFPVCLLVFSMDTDMGYYRWIKEPSQQFEGHLQLNNKNIFRLLDRESLNGIIATVNAWYDNRLKIPA